MIEIILPIVTVGGMGLIFGALLAAAAKIFEVKEDERIPMITDALPGANCGGCGYAGCGAYAAAVAAGEAKVNCCPVGGSEAAKKLAGIMGVEAGSSEKMVAHVMCSGNLTAADNRYENAEGIDCHTANRLAGGMKKCLFGCLGCGSCVEKCAFGALRVENGVAKVDRDKCTNCGACMVECPRKIIKSVPYSATTIVSCCSKAAGKIVRTACDNGCIGCGICVKNCESGAIKLENNVAVIDYSKCTSCGVCAEKCPRKIIEVFELDEELLAALNTEEVVPEVSAEPKIAIARTVEEARRSQREEE